MAKTYPEIDPDMAAWIRAQPLFFVASAPLSADGHVNVSPRGLDTLRVLGGRRIAYLDLTGSGNETAAHLAENGRITVMFCAFEGKPRILRLFGRGRVVRPGEGEWERLRVEFPPEMPGARQIVDIEVDRIQTSCGYGVPLMDYQGQRETLVDWANKKGPDGLAEYWEKKNSRSIDGLPAPALTPRDE